jgi:hypothetical protein
VSRIDGHLEALRTENGSESRQTRVVALSLVRHHPSARQTAALSGVHLTPADGVEQSCLQWDSVVDSAARGHEVARCWQPRKKRLDHQPCLSNEFLIQVFITTYRSCQVPRVDQVVGHTDTDQVGGRDVAIGVMTNPLERCRSSEGFADRKGVAPE